MGSMIVGLVSGELGKYSVAWQRVVTMGVGPLSSESEPCRSLALCPVIYIIIYYYNSEQYEI